MRKKIYVLLWLQILCCIGYWLLPSYLYKVSDGDPWDMANVPLDLLGHHWQDMILLFSAMAICLFFPVYTLVAYYKQKRTLWALFATLLTELLMWWMFWGLYLMSIEDDWEANSQLRGVPFVGLYLLPIAAALTCLIIGLVWIEKRKAGQTHLL